MFYFLADTGIDLGALLTQQGPVVAILGALVLYLNKRNKEIEDKWTIQNKAQMDDLRSEIAEWKNHTEECDDERQNLRHDLQKLMEWVMQLHAKGEIPAVPDFRILSLSLEETQKYLKRKP